MMHTTGLNRLIGKGNTFYNAISKELFANTIPVNPPPIVNKKTNPNAQSIGVSNFNEPPKIVATQLNILIPVGTAIIIVKYALVSTSIPTVHM